MQHPGLPSSSAATADGWAWRRSIRRAAVASAIARRALPALQHLQVPGCGLRAGPGRSRRGEARSSRRLLREGPRHLFAGDQGACRARRHVDGGDLRRGRYTERQHGGQPDARKLRRAVRADLLYALAGRSGDAPRPHRDRAQRGQARRSARHHDACCHAGHHAAPADRGRLVGVIAQSPDRLAAGQQDRRHAACARPAGELAGRRQDRQPATTEPPTTSPSPFRPAARRS